jgi:NADH-quinone oxidoreductase subunit J
MMFADHGKQLGEVDVLERRQIGLEFRQRAGEEMFGADEVPVQGVIIADGDLDHSLVECPRRANRIVPQVFPRVVAIEEFSAVKLVYAFDECLCNHPNIGVKLRRHAPIPKRAIGSGDPGTVGLSPERLREADRNVEQFINYPKPCPVRLYITPWETIFVLVFEHHATCDPEYFLSVATIFFFVLAFVSVLSAILLVTRRNPVHSAIFLIVNFIALAGIYLTLHAQFIAIIQILVYAGAIMVLVVFVIMLLNLQEEAKLAEQLTSKHVVAVAFSGVLLIVIVQVIWSIFGTSQTTQAENALQMGSVEGIGMTLYRSFLFPFELASVLLLVAIIGAVLLAKKRFP